MPPLKKKLAAKKTLCEQLGIPEGTLAEVSVRVEAKISIPGAYSSASVSSESRVACRLEDASMTLAQSIAAAKSKTAVRDHIDSAIKFVAKKAAEQ